MALLVERICAECNAVFHVSARRVRAIGRAKFCSRSCLGQSSARRGVNATGSGERNGNWKGGISQNHSHYTSLFRQRYPEKVKAHRIYRAALKSGVLVRPGTCAACDVACKPHGHHDDYSKPLEVRWLCRACHIAHHASVRRGGPGVISDGSLSLEAAAQYLDAKPRGFDQFVRKHGIPYVLYGRQRRFKKVDLDRALKTLTERQREQQC